MNTTVWLASFDIGKKNFAFCIEEVDVSRLESIPNLPFYERYNKDGSLKDGFKQIIQTVSSTGKIILLENVNLTENTDKSLYLDAKVFLNMTKLLDKYKDYWDKCSTFVIEQQMSFGKRKNNTMALKLAQHCLSYFLFHFAEFKTAIEFPAFHKTKVLGAPKKMSKPERKMWSVNQAILILMDRNDRESLEKITSHKKQDDYADVITQINAFKYLCFVDKSL